MPRKHGSLLDELKQTRPFGSKAQEVTIALLRTTDAVRKRLAQVVEKEGITLQQYNVLRILRGAGGEPLSALEIGDRLIEETPGVSRLLDRLVAKRLIRRDRAVHDRRMLQCSLTDRGAQVLSRLEEPVNAADAEVLHALTPRELTVLDDLLARVRHTQHR
jgi:DNA-binding MarR family transcriptional regulator